MRRNRSITEILAVDSSIIKRSFHSNTGQRQIPAQGYDIVEGELRWHEEFDSHLSKPCIGTGSEMFDAEQPFMPHGCIAQAWSVAKVLRCLVKTADKK